MLKNTIFQKDEISSSLKLEYYFHSKDFPTIHAVDMDTNGRLYNTSFQDALSFTEQLLNINNEWMSNNRGKTVSVDERRMRRKSLLVLIVLFLHRQKNI